MKRPLCEICGQPFDLLSYPAPLCRHCRDKKPHYLAARATFVFDGPIREAIHKLKYGEKTALAPRLAPFLQKTLLTEPSLSTFQPQWIVPIPLHRHRLRERGFNQSALLAKELARLVEVPTVEVLTRIRDTVTQTDLKRVDRAKNVRDAFAVDAAVFNRIAGRGRRFLLVDDVSTTGATLDEAARMLKKAGAGEVCAVTLARRE